MQVNQIKSDYEVIDFSDISNKYDVGLTSIHDYSLYDFVSSELGGSLNNSWRIYQKIKTV